MIKKECFNCKNVKEGNNFSVPVPNTEERTNRFYCPKYCSTRTK